MHEVNLTPAFPRKTKYSGQSTMTGQDYSFIVDVPIGKALADLWFWQNGQLIQEAMPYLSDEQREFLISGYTPNDWEFLEAMGEEPTPPWEIKDKGEAS